MMTTTTTARVYCGTYAKYTGGSLKGRWLDLDDYADSDEFYAACRELHSDEDDPELMFQDWEGIPKGMIGECWIKPELWDFLQLDEWKQEIVAAFWSDIEEGIDAEGILEAHRGQYGDAAEFAEEFAKEAGYLNSNDDNPLFFYVDWQRYWDGELRHSFTTAAMPSGNVAFFNNDY